MSFYIYVFESQMDGTFYKGYSEAPLDRLDQHNSGSSHYTSAKIPWNLIHVEELATKRDALIRERLLRNIAVSR